VRYGFAAHGLMAEGQPKSHSVQAPLATPDSATQSTAWPTKCQIDFRCRRHQAAICVKSMLFSMYTGIVRILTSRTAFAPAALASSRNRRSAAVHPSEWPGVQRYPSRPVRLVVGYAPGGTTDIAARLIGQWLSDRLGRHFIIENHMEEGLLDAPPYHERSTSGYQVLIPT
jgi:hypothetical protein